MKTIYCHKTDLNNVLASISKAQTRSKRFINVSVKPYKGKKYTQDYLTIKIG